VLHHNHSSSRLLRAIAVTGLVTSLLVLAGGSPASAATFTVTTTADGGPGSLRDAFAQASASAEPNEVVLQADATYALTDCGEGDLDYTVNQPLTIVGNGAVIDQDCAGEGVIESDGDITVEDVTITGGDSPGLGGGISADTADVTLVRSTVRGNEASTGGGVGAIHATLIDSTVSGNTASTAGGVWADQTLTVTNSTVSGNEATTAGGGLAVVNTSITLLYGTIAGNTSPVGSNIQLQSGSDELVSFASVVAEPLGGGTNCDIDDGALTDSQGYNFSSEDSCGFGTGPGDQEAGGDPDLGTLAANGGPTQTRLPATGSPLLDAVDCAAAPESVTADQRGVSRPQNGRCDVGAVEVEVAGAPSAPAPASPAAPVTAATPQFTG
jgi:hypothetical protein